MRKTHNPPVILPVSTTKKKPYEKPYFQVIPLKLESSLLAGSQGESAGFNPIQRKPTE